MKKLLTIAGSDCSGGAGIQADLKTFAANGCYGMSVITALTAQNTTGVSGIMEVSPEFAGMQLDAVFTDIFPDAVKIGMVSDPALVEVIAEKLTQYQAKNIVLDPVMVATSGSALSKDSAIYASQQKLFPLAAVITPNIPETMQLTGMSAIDSKEKMLQAAKCLQNQTSGGILIKGGHLAGDADDLLYWNGEAYWMTGEKIDNPNTHGTGCTLSSAIACFLAKGEQLPEAVRHAKDYLTGAIADKLDLGKGRGPLNHLYRLKSE